MRVVKTIDFPKSPTNISGDLVTNKFYLTMAGSPAVAYFDGDSYVVTNISIPSAGANQAVSNLYMQPVQGMFPTTFVYVGSNPDKVAALTIVSRLSHMTVVTCTLGGGGGSWIGFDYF